jgi:hypothetical protein
MVTRIFRDMTRRSYRSRLRSPVPMWEFPQSETETYTRPRLLAPRLPVVLARISPRRDPLACQRGRAGLCRRLDEVSTWSSHSSIRSRCKHRPLAARARLKKAHTSRAVRISILDAPVLCKHVGSRLAEFAWEAIKRVLRHFAVGPPSRTGSFVHVGAGECKGHWGGGEGHGSVGAVRSSTRSRSKAADRSVRSTQPEVPRLRFRPLRGRKLRSG